MQILRQGVAVSALTEMAEGMFGNLVKAVVDVERTLMAVINIRPRQGNRTRSVDDPTARAAVTAAVDHLITR